MKKKIKKKEFSKKTKIFAGIISAVMVFSILNAIFPDDKETKQEDSIKVVAPTPTREQLLEKQFSAWDGSHRNLTKYIKDSMNNPKSYEHVKTVYWDQKDFLIVATTFRGENAFGGIVTNTVKAEISMNGDIIKIFE